MVATLDQAAIRLDLRSTQGDPLGLACLARNGAGWAGSYVVSSPGTAAAPRAIVETMAAVLVAVVVVLAWRRRRAHEPAAAAVWGDGVVPVEVVSFDPLKPCRFRSSLHGLGVLDLLIMPARVR